MRRTSPRDRDRIAALFMEGFSDPMIAQRVGWSVATVYKWRCRAQAELSPPPMGRPLKGAISSFAEPIKQALFEVRRLHPGWGPLSLRDALTERFGEKAVPSRSAIARWLHGAGLAKPYRNVRPLPQAPPDRPTFCHQLWEMDAKGYQTVEGVGIVSLIDLTDVFSRVKLLSWPFRLGETDPEHHPTTETYQTVLRRTFTEWGLPNAWALDHDSVFFDNTHDTPFPTLFHLWLVGLGIDVQWGPSGRPTDRAIIERSHQTWDHQVLEGAAFRGESLLFETLLARRDVMNLRLPSASCGGRPPLRVHPEARIPLREYRPDWEVDLLDLGRVRRVLAPLEWIRTPSVKGVFSLGRPSYGLGRLWAKQTIAITFDPKHDRFVIRPTSVEGPIRETTVSSRGLTRLDLMGRNGASVGLGSYQMALPYSPEDRELLRPRSDRTRISTDGFSEGDDVRADSDRFFGTVRSS